MKFWDSSAFVPLLIEQPSTERLRPLRARDPEMALWWGTVVECAGALARVRREGKVSAPNQLQALSRLDELWTDVYEIQPDELVRSRAVRLVTVYHLRAADALQLAAALVWCREQPYGFDFVCVDARLSLAAAREGFRVLPYVEEVHEPPAPEYAARA